MSLSFSFLQGVAFLCCNLHLLRRNHRYHTEGAILSSAHIEHRYIILVPPFYVNMDLTDLSLKLLGTCLSLIESRRL